MVLRVTSRPETPDLSSFELLDLTRVPLKALAKSLGNSSSELLDLMRALLEGPTPALPTPITLQKTLCALGPTVASILVLHVPLFMWTPTSLWPKVLVPPRPVGLWHILLVAVTTLLRPVVTCTPLVHVAVPLYRNVPEHPD